MTIGKKRVIISGFVVFSILCSLFYAAHIRPPEAEAGDSPEYLLEAYHIYNHGVFSSSPSPDGATPGIGREPGYATVLAMIMAVDPAFSRFMPDCVEEPRSCDDRIYRAPQLANAVLIGLAGLTLFAATWLLTGSPLAATVAGGYLLLNLQMHKGWYYIASDHLALWLLTLVMLATVWAARSKGGGRWLVVGGTLAALTLVKAVFLYFTMLSLVAAAVVALARPQTRRLVSSAGLAVFVVYSLMIGGGWPATTCPRGV
ncbi:hypothetical protein [Azospirillum thermophilum]|nr:hypothetical protein [Azospirillum thermophilum]